ncbi:MAG TPA: MBL fold metallo-hydrolase [Vicinamibacterales bacterium]|nr:MBL fold metallo-hydrolase [Vicinamibacterales bacterium]
MTRALVLGLLVAVGSITMLAAQQPATDKPKIVEVEKVKDNLFVLRGAGGGGNTAVFVMSSGVAVVDAKNPGWGAPILAKIKELTPKPVTLLINTHTHGDHVSGNVEFPASVDVVVQENTKTNMEKMPIFKEHNNNGMAKRTFKDRMTIGRGADQIDLYYFGRGHTNGDAWIVFPAHRIVHSGDIFAGKSVPLIDGNNGGSMVEIPATLRKAHSALMKNVDQIINGHTPAQTTMADLNEFVQFNEELVAYGRAGLKAGKTPEQLAAEWTLPEKYKGYSSQVSSLMGGLPGRFQLLQKELQ